MQWSEHISSYMHNQIGPNPSTLDFLLLVDLVITYDWFECDVIVDREATFSVRRPGFMVAYRMQRCILLILEVLNFNLGRVKIKWQQ